MSRNWRPLSKEGAKMGWLILQLPQCLVGSTSCWSRGGSRVTDKVPEKHVRTIEDKLKFGYTYQMAFLYLLISFDPMDSSFDPSENIDEVTLDAGVCLPSVCSPSAASLSLSWFSENVSPTFSLTCFAASATSYLCNWYIRVWLAVLEKLFRTPCTVVENSFKSELRVAIALVDYMDTIENSLLYAFELLCPSQQRQGSRNCTTWDNSRVLPSLYFSGMG